MNHLEKAQAYLDVIGWSEGVPSGVFDAIKTLIDCAHAQQAQIEALHAQISRIQEAQPSTAMHAVDLCECGRVKADWRERCDRCRGRTAPK